MQKLQAHAVDALGGILFDQTGTRILSAMAGVPTNSVSGYLVGGLYIDTTNSSLYRNDGTAASSSFTLIGGAGDTVTGTTFDLTAGAATFTVKTNTAAVLRFTDGTTVGYEQDTRNTIANTSSNKFTGQPCTIATAAAAHLNPTVEIAAKTITYTGTATVTSSLGAGLYIGAPTFTDAAAGTLSLASNLHVAAVAAAGGSLTLTAARMISTGVSDCYLTNAGVWTDTACFAAGKASIAHASASAIHRLLDAIVPKSWTYRTDVHGDDGGRERFGVVYDDLPGELLAPGAERAVSPGLLASFALAALRVLRDDNAELRRRLDRLESA